jgi:hypothetical protein
MGVAPLLKLGTLKQEMFSSSVATLKVKQGSLKDFKLYLDFPRSLTWCSF